MYRWLVAKGVTFGYRRVVAGSFHGKAELDRWLRRFASLSPEFRIHDVLVAGPPWNTRVAMTFSDAIGADYRNRGMEYLRLRWGKVKAVEVYLNTETIHAWEQRHPELVSAGAA
jgi:hypothetical protein